MTLLRARWAASALALILIAARSRAEDSAAGPPPPATPQAAAPAAAPSLAAATLAEPSRAWHLYGGLGYGGAGGGYGEFLEEPIQFELRIAKQTGSGAWRFGAGLQFGSLDMKPPYQDQEEWAHLETFATLTRVFRPHARVRPYLQGRVGIVRIHPRSELF
jgi:hypothetical protein